METKEEKKQVTISGRLTPADWDEDGNVIAVELSTLLDDDYLIDADAAGRELLRFSGAEVSVTGIMNEDKCGKKRIAVKRYEILQVENEDEEELSDEDEFEEEEYEDEEEQWEE